MNTEPAKQATDKSVLLAELLDHNVPKSEREHFAIEEIRSLQLMQDSLESLLHRQGWDIERLKITIKQLQDEINLQNKDRCDDDEAIKQQALRVLPKEVVEGDSVHVPRMGELAKMMADEIERLRIWNSRWKDLATKLKFKE